MKLRTKTLLTADPLMADGIFHSSVKMGELKEIYSFGIRYLEKLATVFTALTYYDILEESILKSIFVFCIWKNRQNSEFVNIFILFKPGTSNASNNKVSFSRIKWKYYAQISKCLLRVLITAVLKSTFYFGFSAKVPNIIADHSIFTQSMHIFP